MENIPEKKKNLEKCEVVDRSLAPTPGQSRHQSLNKN
jgi:hypothetical protein